MNEKIIQAVLIALILWAGSQIVRVEVLSNRMDGMGDEQKQHQRALEGLLDLHLQRSP